MTAIVSTGASSASPKDVWSDLPWSALNGLVLRLQMRIAKAEREGRRGKVRALQRLLTTSFAAKCSAVKRVTSNQGKNTPGVDGKIWRSDRQKLHGVFDLKRNGYTPQPLRRIYIPKKSNLKKLRPLSIPTMKDRAMQALHLLSLEPIVEERVDPNAYGFRLKRSCHDAREQCFNALSRARSATWVLEGDIKACFDRINHDYLLKEIPMDKTILRKLLKTGFMEKNQLYPTTSGTPQGGTLSPALAILALSGLERCIRSTNDRQRKREKINMIAYADDFIVTASSKELLTDKVIPELVKTLAPVGLEVSPTKTKIAHINDGFDFLGFNVRKYNDGKLLIKPAKANIKAFLKEIRTTIKKGAALPTEQLIYTLNSRGYRRMVHAARGQGINIGRSAVQRVMRKYGIVARYKRKYKTTTDSLHTLPIASNLLNREFNVSAPNQVWLNDITYVQTQEGWLYLATTLDLYSRKIVRWAMDQRMQKSLVFRALQMALQYRKPIPSQKLMHHSDRGFQYASPLFQKLLKANDIRCSRVARETVGIMLLLKAFSAR